MTIINFHSNNRIIHNGHSMPMFNSCFGNFSPGCFGFGYNRYCGDSFGMGLGMAAGMCLVPALPAIFKGIGKGCTWLWNNAIAPAGKAIGQGCAWLWNNAIAPLGKAIGKGVSNLWNNIFPKKSKTEKADN